MEGGGEGGAGRRLQPGAFFRGVSFGRRELVLNGLLGTKTNVDLVEVFVGQGHSMGPRLIHGKRLQQQHSEFEARRTFMKPNYLEQANRM